MAALVPSINCPLMRFKTIYTVSGSYTADRGRQWVSAPINISDGVALVCHCGSWRILGRNEFWEPSGLHFLGKITVGLEFLGYFAAGIVVCPCWSCTSCPACPLSFGLLAFPSRGLAAWFPRHRGSVTVVLDCEPSSPTMDLFQLLEVLLEARSQAHDALLSVINAFDVDIVEMPSISLLIHPQLSPDSRSWNVPCTYVLSGSGTFLERSCCVNWLVTK